MKPATACIAVGLLVAGCAGPAERAPTTEVTRIPSNGDWFCQLAASGGGWECVQDEELAERPRPERLPEPQQTPAPEPVPLPDMESESTVPDNEPAPLPDPASPDAPSPPTEQLPPVDPAPTPGPAAPAAGTATATAGTPGSRDTAPPAYLRLAYQPEQPVALSDLPGDFYAVQLVAMATAAQIEAFMHRHGMEGMPAARVERDGEIYYVLLLGIYESFDRARQAIADLPPPFEDTSPWIRPMRSLQAAMRRAQELQAAGD